MYWSCYRKSHSYKIDARHVVDLQRSDLETVWTHSSSVESSAAPAVGE
jgi:hypothetical protein